MCNSIVSRSCSSLFREEGQSACIIDDWLIVPFAYFSDWCLFSCACTKIMYSLFLNRYKSSRRHLRQQEKRKKKKGKKRRNGEGKRCNIVWESAVYLCTCHPERGLTSFLPHLGNIQAHVHYLAASTVSRKKKSHSRIRPQLFSLSAVCFYIAKELRLMVVDMTTASFFLLALLHILTGITCRAIFYSVSLKHIHFHSYYNAATVARWQIGSDFLLTIFLFFFLGGGRMCWDRFAWFILGGHESGFFSFTPPTSPIKLDCSITLYQFEMTFRTVHWSFGDVSFCYPR